MLTRIGFMSNGEETGLPPATELRRSEFRVDLVVSHMGFPPSTRVEVSNMPTAEAPAFRGTALTTPSHGEFDVRIGVGHESRSVPFLRFSAGDGKIYLGDGSEFDLARWASSYPRPRASYNLGGGFEGHFVVFPRVSLVGDVRMFARLDVGASFVFPSDVFYYLGTFIVEVDKEKWSGYDWMFEQYYARPREATA